MKKRTKIITALFAVMVLVVLPYLAVLKYGTGKQVSELSENYFRDGGGFYYLPDDDCLYGKKRYVEGADNEGFQVIGERFAKDKDNFYQCERKVLEDVEVKTAECLEYDVCLVNDSIYLCYDGVKSKEEYEADKAHEVSYTKAQSTGCMEYLAELSPFILIVIIALCCWLIPKARIIKQESNDSMRRIGLLVAETIVLSPVLLLPLVLVLTVLGIKYMSGYFVPLLILLSFNIYPLYLWAVNDYAELTFSKTGRLRYAFLAQLAGILLVIAYYLVLLCVLY